MKKRKGLPWRVSDLSLTLHGAALPSGAFTGTTVLHAITAGTLGSLTIGMITRVAISHTGGVTTNAAGITA